MNKHFTLILLTIIAVGCQNKAKNEANFYRYIQEKYQGYLKKYPPALVDIFPTKIAKVYSMSMTTDITNECIYLAYYDLDTLETKKNINQLDSNLKHKSLAIYNAMDSNLISIRDKGLIYTDPTLEMFYDKIIVNHRYYYPILFFEEDDSAKEQSNIFSKQSPIGLSKDFTIYVIDSKVGKFWKGLSPSEHMPKGWENGYSKGVCINKKLNIIIYWAVIW